VIIKINGLTSLICLFSFLIIGFGANATNLDSLENVVKTTDDVEVKIETTIEIGRHYKTLAMDSAIFYYNSAIDMATHSSNYELVAEAGMALSSYYAFASENTEKAFSAACEARDIVHYLGDTSKVYIAYCGWCEFFGGMREIDRGNYSRAQEYFLNAIQFFDQTGNPKSSLIAYDQLTVLYSIQNMFLECLNILDKTILLCEENEWVFEEMIFRSKKGSIQYMQGRNVESISSLKSAIKMIYDHLDTSDYYHFGLIYEDLGNNYFEIENYDSSYYYHTKALYYNNILNIPSSIIASNAHLAQDCVMRGELDLSKMYCDVMQIQIDSIQTPAQKLIGCEAWISYYKASEQHALALDKMDTLLMLKEAMVNERNIQEQTAQKMDFEFEKERLFSEKEIELKNDKIEAEQIYNSNLKIGLGILGVLLLGFALLFYSNFKQRKIISEKNEKLNESVEEKETLLKEIHHRVKNNLQLISSLLGLQSESIDDAKVLSAFEEGQNRVQAMALIHQKLYQNDVASEIDFQDYLQGLAGHFTDMNATDKKVIFEIDCEDIKLDIDTAIPLGLIINELFTNAYKHAFKNIEFPKLSVSIKRDGEGEYMLKMTDNGEGLPADLDWSKTKTLGLRLIRNLVKQLIGKINYENHENLSVFSIQFKNQLGRSLLE
jgi:two-component sensor histidine kinase